jgi:hypothetical protein
MLKRLCASLIMVIVACAGGALVGYIVGSILYERAQERVQTNPHSAEGDVGGYLCAAGHLPTELGMFGAALGAAIGLGIGIGEAVWAEMKESKAERE